MRTKKVPGLPMTVNEATRMCQRPPKIVRVGGKSPSFAAAGPLGQVRVWFRFFPLKRRV